MSWTIDCYIKIQNTFLMFHIGCGWKKNPSVAFEKPFETYTMNIACLLEKVNPLFDKYPLMLVLIENGGYLALFKMLE